MSERPTMTTRNGVTSMKRSVPFTPKIQQVKASSGSTVVRNPGIKAAQGNGTRTQAQRKAS